MGVSCDPSGCTVYRLTAPGAPVWKLLMPYVENTISSLSGLQSGWLANIDTGVIAVASPPPMSTSSWPVVVLTPLGSFRYRCLFRTEMQRRSHSPRPVASADLTESK